MTSNRKFLASIVAVAALYAAACMWATRWIDAQLIGEHPDRHAVRIARALWAIAPRVDRERDIERALKLSWFTAAGETASGHHDLRSVMKVIEREFRFTAEQLGRHLDVMTPALARQYMTQLVTYLNRIEAFQPYPAPALEARLAAFAAEIANEPDARVRENWHREMMIRASIKQDIDNYRTQRDAHARALAAAGSGTAAFQGGVVAMYDGVLACIAGHAERAGALLRAATRQLARDRATAREVVQGHLNALLFARAMAAPGCEEPVRRLVGLAG